MSDVESAGATGDSRKGVIPWSPGTVKEVLFQDRGGEAFTEGDIRIGDTQSVLAMAAKQPRLIPKGMGVIGEKYRWPGGRIAYQISPSLPEPQRVLEAIAHWEKHTDIRFIERTTANANQHGNYLLFCERGGSWSYVGMQGGEQPLSLGRDAHMGNVIHEIGHAVGLWHEQSRVDRNDHLVVLTENIRADMLSQFDQKLKDGMDLGDYDFDSVMHYPRTAFSKNGRDTLRPRTDESRTIGQREKLSAGDIAAVKALYPKP
ncbi:M12 family metallopeptidase [Pyxidicoccus sp. 3LG]